MHSYHCISSLASRCRLRRNTSTCRGSAWRDRSWTSCSSTGELVYDCNCCSARGTLSDLKLSLGQRQLAGLQSVALLHGVVQTAGCCFPSSIFSSKSHPAIQDGKLKLCNLCSKHLKKHNPPFKCTLDQCGEAFRYKKDLIRHQGSKHHEIVRHLPIWYCSYSNCKFSRERGSGFARKDNYNRHIQTQHGGCVSGP